MFLANYFGSLQFLLRKNTLISHSIVISPLLRPLNRHIEANLVTYCLGIKIKHGFERYFEQRRGKLKAFKTNFDYLKLLLRVKEKMSCTQYKTDTAIKTLIKPLNQVKQ